MRLSLVSTGEEILRGEVLDTNAAFAADLLDQHGFVLVRHHTTGDDLEAIAETFRLALAEATLVIASGGLGPTQDDRTVEALAQVAEVPLVEDAAIRRGLSERFQSLGLLFTENQLRQARLPAGALAIPNPRGTAPGIDFSFGGKRVFCLPGPPREFEPMLTEAVLPPLKTERARREPAIARGCRVLRVFGRGEGHLAHELDDLPHRIPNLELGFRATMPEVHIKLRLARPTAAEVARALDEAEALARERLGPHVFASNSRSLPEVVLDLLRERHQTLALAESCTGGLCAKLLTDVPGSSDVLLLSAVTYADRAKQAVLGVDPALLEAHGAVSAECARAMAEGARRVAQSDIAVAITGIAGPAGGSTEKPVGLVYFALADAAGTITRERRFGPLSRDFIRRLAAHTALDLVRRGALRAL